MTLLARLFLACSILFASPALAQPAPPAATPLVVATREAPPFAMREQNGEWSGLAIDLWRGIAQDEGINYRFEEASAPDMVAGVADGRYAASVGALTVTPGREARIDFTHPFYTTGFGIATARGTPGWLVLIRNIFTWGFLQAILALAALLIVVGALFWLAERRTNRDEFGGKPWRGIASGFWFSAVTMTTVGYGDKAPKSLAGKAIAVVWMFGAILIISTFTGMIASSLTESRINGAIRTVDDLQSARVGSIGGSAADDWLKANGVGFGNYASVNAGLDAIEAGTLDAFVYDRPLLRYRVNARDGGTVRLVRGSFGRQDYAFGLPQGSPLRERINEALLRRIDSRAWTDHITETLGGEE